MAEALKRFPRYELDDLGVTDQRTTEPRKADAGGAAIIGRKRCRGRFQSRGSEPTLLQSAERRWRL